FFFSSRRRHTRWPRDWSSDVCSSDLQFTQRGWVNTLPSSVNIAADRAAVSAIEAKLSGVARLSDCWETPSRVGVPVSRAASATRSEERRVGKEWRAQWGAGQ